MKAEIDQTGLNCIVANRVVVRTSNACFRSGAGQPGDPNRKKREAYPHTELKLPKTLMSQATFQPNWSSSGNYREILWQVAGIYVG